jgi:Ca2+:H+ antiporter
MNESSDEPPLQDRIRSWAREKAYDSKFNPFGGGSHGQILPLANPRSENDAANHPSTATACSSTSSNDDNSKRDHGGQNVSDKRPSALPPPAPPPVGEEQKGEEPAPIDQELKPGSFKRFLIVVKTIMLSSWINVGLVFVPVGIGLGAVNKASPNGHIITPSIVFAMNAVAIIPLAGLLSFATESVAAKLGDTMGALLNVSFGNAVELIILYVSANLCPFHPIPKLMARSACMSSPRYQTRRERQSLQRAQIFLNS